ncbi:hypothetical protein EsDP_00001080 [Epichloe bromicola]|uniref:Tetratricopeptide-like helical n=1 Tax=Epichloe bromicola TaxID=79588 RepID=A0ABQ0CGU5_9HYPO
MATRRAVKPCLAAHLAKPALFTCQRNLLSVTSHLMHHHQGRGYAAPASRKPAPSRSEVFNLSQIPQTSFESVISRNGNSFKHLSCAEYYVVAQKFTEAIRRGSSPWAVSFSPKDEVSAETLHAVACIMRQIRSSSADAFATALWSSASEMGHRPATLSLARQLIRSGAYSRIPQLRRVEARFKQLLGSGRDADALTAEGELLLEQGRYDGAATLLRRALHIGGDFEWRPYCELCLGKVYAKTGREDDAREMFARLADAGMVEADVELVDLLRRSDSEESEQRMYTAACNGRSDMFTRLSEAELEKENGERRLWAMEWSRLADQRVEY